jgi:hypothetical protein
MTATEENSMATTIVRAGGPTSLRKDFGLLSNLPGRWVGKGFNLFARPARQGIAANPVFFLELNATMETLEFGAVGGDVPDRGFSEPTSELHAIHYLQTVNDSLAMTAIHFEPGNWLHVPRTADCSESYVREATIPHGDSLLSQSTFFTTMNGGPILNPVNSLPFRGTDPIPGLNDNPANPLGAPYTDPYTNPVEGPNGNAFPANLLAAGLNPAQTIKDPTAVLRAAIANQTFVSTDVIQISTTLPGGMVNVPFVKADANAVQMDAIFWIETVAKDPEINRNNEYPKSQFYQLQYVQRVILDFDNVHWPHISAATLIKE